MSAGNSDINVGVSLDVQYWSMYIRNLDELRRMIAQGDVDSIPEYLEGMYASLRAPLRALLERPSDVLKKRYASPDYSPKKLGLGSFKKVSSSFDREDNAELEDRRRATINGATGLEYLQKFTDVLDQAGVLSSKNIVPTSQRKATEQPPLSPVEPLVPRDLGQIR